MQAGQSQAGRRSVRVAPGAALGVAKMSDTIVHTMSTSAAPEITRVEFGIPSADEVRKQSVVEINNTSVYRQGKPCLHGINDHRMGSHDKRIRCATCGNTSSTCMGHFGHIELGVPVYMSNVQDMILKTLRMTCFMCSRLRIDDTAAAALREHQR